MTRISPDGSRALVAITTPTRAELWFADWARNVWTACGDCAEDARRSDRDPGAWSPDGRRLLLARSDEGNGSLVAVTIDRSKPEQVLIREEGRRLEPRAWLADGRIVYESSPDRIRYEIKLLEPGATSGRGIVPLGEGTDSAVSPDGRWLAYMSGRDAASPTASNVVVEAFPGRGSRTQVSAGGGRNAAWSRDGRTLYYLNITQPGRTSSVVFATNITAGADAISVGAPREILRRPDGQGCLGRCYDISEDGRFLFRDRANAKRESVTRMDLVLNWTSTLPRHR